MKDGKQRIKVESPYHPDFPKHAKNLEGGGKMVFGKTSMGIKRGRPPLPKQKKKERRWVFLQPSTWLFLEQKARQANCSVSKWLQHFFDDLEN